MKINLSPSKRNQGSALFITVMIAVAVAATVATYLLMVQGQYRSVIRSQTWNNSLVVAEAGVEEALAFVNKYQGTTTTNALSNWTNGVVSNITPDGWAYATSAGNQVYTMSRTLTNGSYAVIITNVFSGSNYVPVILSTGTATWRLDTASAAQPMFASSGVAASSPTRTIFVQTKADSNLTGGLISQTTMDFHGNNVTVDSYDSSKNTNSW